MVTICDLKTERWEADIRTVFGIPNEADAVWYCETNHTSKLKVCVNIDEGRRPRPLEKVKYVAMLVLAFEEEIDKMLADHVGYINEDVRHHHDRRNPFHVANVPGRLPPALTLTTSSSWTSTPNRNSGVSGPPQRCKKSST